jgi:hypothetical protein
MTAPKSPIRQTLDDLNVLADWYRHHKPEVQHIVVTAAQYQAIEQAVGTRGISIHPDGIRYRGFRIEAQM